MKKSMLLKLDANNAKDPITLKIAHSKKKGRPLRKLTTHAYRDKGMGDVIIGKSFLREVGIKARRFEGTITLYKDNTSVTYQMVQSHPRFKHHTNEQCNKILPILKVSDDDMMNGILHPYQ
uniref:Uncharacterized protein n=1 Tax=Tanacetum cinerariifolium TaxID=118510 RepID=A0A699KJR5_TANCI|nr:hypothetical protein [Tanacetum cinerariifolium]